MNGVIAVFRKELRSYFNSPIAYIAVVFFLAFTAVWLFYVQQFFVRDTASLRGYFGIMPIIFIGLLPALTMRSWAEESKLGTGELLLTMPLTETQLVLGKFAAAVGLLVLSLVLSLFVPLSVSPFGDFESGQIIGEYLGVLLLGAAGIAIGQFVSAVSRNQISAFLISAVVLLFFTLISSVNQVVDVPGPLASVFNYLSLDYHFQSFVKGVIDTRDLVYFVIVSALFLFLNVRVLVLRKWG